MDGIGHNKPPTPMEEIEAKFGDFFLEAENWCDGKRVETDAQMEAIDAIVAAMKSAEKAAKASKEREYRPHKAAGDAVVAAWKPVLDRINTYKSALLATVGEYKKEKARLVEIERQRLADEAAAKAREAEVANNTADMADLAQRKEADEIAFAAREAERAAQTAAKGKPTGLRKFWTYDITDGRELVNWIARNDRPAMQEFIEEYARKQVQQGTRQLAGVLIYQEQRAV